MNKDALIKKVEKWYSALNWHFTGGSWKAGLCNRITENGVHFAVSINFTFHTWPIGVTVEAHQATRPCLVEAAKQTFKGETLEPEAIEWIADWIIGAVKTTAAKLPAYEAAIQNIVIN